MLTTGIGNFKTNLRKYISHVRKGEAILITDHGKPVARLVPEEIAGDTLERRIHFLVKSGAVIPPKRPLSKSSRKPLPLEGKPLSRIIAEDRR